MSDKVYAALTDRIIAQLEAGVVPWSRPWNRTAAWPVNLKTKKFYRGYNVLNLSWTMVAHGFKHNVWLSFKQASDLGGKIIKGQGHATKVLFHKVYKKKEYDEDLGEVVERVVYVSPRYTPVWNIEQIEGLDDKLEALLEKLDAKPNEIPEHELGERVPDAIGVTLRYVGGQAVYYPSRDEINMPERGSFKSVGGFYGTLFHECGHSTGHADRLNRPELVASAGFGSIVYSREELTAEMYSIFLASILGVETEPKFENNAAYIASWLKKFDDDRKVLVDAAKDAEAAVRWTLDKLGITEYNDGVSIETTDEPELEVA